MIKYLRIFQKNLNDAFVNSILSITHFGTYLKEMELLILKIARATYKGRIDKSLFYQGARKNLEIKTCFY